MLFSAFAGTGAYYRKTVCWRDGTLPRGFNGLRNGLNPVVERIAKGFATMYSTRFWKSLHFTHNLIVIAFFPVSNLKSSRALLESQYISNKCSKFIHIRFIESVLLHISTDYS